MLKAKVTKKAMKERFSTILAPIDVQVLLQYQRPFAYSTRVEGWACDYYDINGVLVSVGDSPLKPKNTNNSYAIERPFEEQARAIRGDYSLSYEEQKEKINDLLFEYIEKIRN